MKTIIALIEFVNRPPELQKKDFKRSRDYSAAVKESNWQRNDFYELLAWVWINVGDEAQDLVTSGPWPRSRIQACELLADMLRPSFVDTQRLSKRVRRIYFDNSTAASINSY